MTRATIAAAMLVLCGCSTDAARQESAEATRKELTRLAVEHGMADPHVTCRPSTFGVVCLLSWSLGPYREVRVVHCINLRCEFKAVTP